MLMLLADQLDDGCDLHLQQVQDTCYHSKEWFAQNDWPEKMSKAPGTCTKCGKNSFNVMTLHIKNSNGHCQQLTIFVCILKVLSRIPLVRPNKSTLSSVCSLYLETNSSDDVSLGTTSLGEMSILVSDTVTESFWITILSQTKFHFTT